MLRFSRRTRADRTREFAQIATRLQKERAEAPGIVDALLQKTPRADWSALVEFPELQTGGHRRTPRESLRRVAHQDAVHAKAIAELAVAISETLSIITPGRVIPLTLRGSYRKVKRSRPCPDPARNPCFIAPSATMS